MSPFPDDLVSKAVYQQRFAGLALADVDLQTYKTWDVFLPRNYRILVPIDVQAFVVPEQGGEATVPVGAVMGDPEAFGASQVRPAGVHLHWALPDKLLAGVADQTAKKLVMPALPDRWVVVRTLLPEGASTAYATGWVVDATNGVVVPLTSFAGTIDPTGGTALTPLDATSRGTLLWSATYTGAERRFTLHDPLTDLPGLEPIAPNGFHRNIATYTVAGWWTRLGEDPLASAFSRRGVRDRAQSLGWTLPEDGEDAILEDVDPRVQRRFASAGLKSRQSTTTVTRVEKYSSSKSTYAEAAPIAKMPVEGVVNQIVGIASTRYNTLLHGSVVGVPIDGDVGSADDRPARQDVTGAVGLDVDDVASAFAAPGFGLAPDRRQLAERLFAAFTSNMLTRLSTSDGLVDVEEHEHADGFWPMPGKPLPGSTADRLRTEDHVPYSPTQVGRKSRAGQRHVDTGIVGSLVLESSISWRGGVIGLKTVADHQSAKAKAPSPPTASPTAPSAPPPESRTVTRPAPRMFRPAPVVVGLRSIKPSLRHHGDGLYDNGKLRCRFPAEVKARFKGAIDGATILPTLGNGAIPPEVLRVVREAIVYDGYSWKWLAASAARPGLDESAIATRLQAEMTRIYGTNARYDASGATAVSEFVSGGHADGGVWAAYDVQKISVQKQVAAEVARFSLLDGAPPSPVAITTWRQPWVPLFLDWQVRIDGADRLEGWALGDLDFTGAPAANDLTRTFVGRSTISTGVGKAIQQAIKLWIDEEDARDLAGASQLSEADEASLKTLGNLVGSLDLVSASLDGLREQLLGIPYSGFIVRERSAPEEDAKPTATGLPTPFFGGELTIERLRVVDAFGRTLDLGVDAVPTTRSLELPGKPASVRLPPRIQHGARWLLRLVDPSADITADPTTAAEAYVDQLRGPDAVTPVSGFLLPDHVDEALEVFDRDGNPLGQVMHDTVTDAVTWEPAPGRPLPPDAGPMAAIPEHAQHAALVAAGLVQADITTRHSGEPATHSTLSAMLRAIDSTLWSVDTFAALGSPTVAGLVGRPIAVVRATVMLDVPDDVDEVVVTAPGGAEARAAAFAALEDLEFPFRIGELGRSDDAVLGFFVDDDYTHFHIVDKVVASTAPQSGRHTGHLGLLGASPVVEAIDHPFIVPEDTLFIRPGKVRTLTILMLPAGKVHLTSGILPRKALQLADVWVTPGLEKLSPSIRVGPLLVDPAEIRLPNVSSLPKGQVFTRRTGPLTWRDDPILASTTNAYLPRMPHEIQEGWIRVGPKLTAEGQPT
ncbi:MAG: hypothetical protein ACOH16_07085 [Propionibacteriaceae bacterium]